MPKIILKGYIDVPDSKLNAVKEALPLHIELTRQEEGCLEFQVEQDKINRNIFNVYEEFANKKSFEEHQNRVQSSGWGKLTENIERYYQIIEE